MSFRLLIDTTRTTLMLAIAQGKELIFTFNDKKLSYSYHSAILIPKIQEALSYTNLTVNDLSDVAINRGPGSFTGIRTGLTVARVIGQFLPIKTYGFNTFELIGGYRPFINQSVTVILNAFRGQHYFSTLKVSENCSITWINEPTVNDNSSSVRVNSDICVIDSSLKDKLQVYSPNIHFIEDVPLFTPEIMVFYLHYQPERYLLPWSEMTPLYMQMPHITISHK